jgi:N-methylhydantoinase B
VLESALSFIPEEMGVSLQRTAYSPNIKERMDASCALFDADGNLVAQAEHIPVHLGSMPLAVEAIKADFGDGLEDGDQVVLNNPYRGGTHLPDITVIKPVFQGPSRLAYVANRAHHADVGGIAAGSMPAESERLEDEGLVINPELLLRKGAERRAVFDRIRRATVNPVERLGDLRAQVAANELGSRRVLDFARRHAPGFLAQAAAELMDYSERRVRSSIASLPRGSWTGTDRLESPEGRGPRFLPIRARVTTAGDEIQVDFEGTHAQTASNLNAPFAVTLSSVYYALRCLTDPDIPANAGAYRPVRVTAPEGSIVRAQPPAAVAAGNVETSQRIVDVVFAALRAPLPDRVPAQSQGTMNNLTIGSASRPRFSYYETIAGGEGALPYRDGADGVQTHMTNTKNTPVEALELAYPLRVEEYRLIDGSGGAGRFHGGDGIRRAVRVLGAGTTVSVISERRRLRPHGANGGSDGRAGRNWIIHRGRRGLRPAKFTERLSRGDVIMIETPGGGGWGNGERANVAGRRLGQSGRSHLAPGSALPNRGVSDGGARTERPTGSARASGPDATGFPKVAGDLAGSEEEFPLRDSEWDGGPAVYRADRVRTRR